MTQVLTNHWWPELRVGAWSGLYHTWFVCGRFAPFLVGIAIRSQDTIYNDMKGKIMGHLDHGSGEVGSNLLSNNKVDIHASGWMIPQIGYVFAALHSLLQETHSMQDATVLELMQKWPGFAAGRLLGDNKFRPFMQKTSQRWEAITSAKMPQMIAIIDAVIGRQRSTCDHHISTERPWQIQILRLSGSTDHAVPVLALPDNTPSAAKPNGVQIIAQFDLAASGMELVSELSRLEFCLCFPFSFFLGMRLYPKLGPFTRAAKQSGHNDMARIPLRLCGRSLGTTAVVNGGGRTRSSVQP